MLKRIAVLKMLATLTLTLLLVQSSALADDRFPNVASDRENIRRNAAALVTMCVRVAPGVFHCNQHAENENLRLQNLWDGIETLAAIMMMK